MNPPAPRIKPFFLEASPGQRFCVYHPPAGPEHHANILYVHAFADEMNRSRRTVALQARAFAEQGCGVLLMDLYGCGDSSGEFDDARWEIWQEDIARGLRWLDRKAEAPTVLWGLRLGVPLMLSYAKTCDRSVDSFLMWQPVVSGEVHLNQFLRLRLAGDMLAGLKGKVGTRDLRSALAGGQTLEIAGYALSPELAHAIGACNLRDLDIPGGNCHWFEVTALNEIMPASRAVIERWREGDMSVGVEHIRAEPFWSSQEIVECHALVDATNLVISAIAA